MGVYILAYGSDKGPHFSPKLDQIGGPLSGNTGPRERERERDRDKERKKERKKEKKERKKRKKERRK